MEGLTTQVWVSTHYLQTPGLNAHYMSCSTISSHARTTRVRTLSYFPRNVYRTVHSLTEKKDSAPALKARALARTVARKLLIGGLCDSAGVLCVCAGGAWHSKNWQKSTDYSVSRFNFGRAWSFVWVGKLTKAPLLPCRRVWLWRENYRECLLTEGTSSSKFGSMLSYARCDSREPRTS